MAGRPTNKISYHPKHHSYLKYFYSLQRKHMTVMRVQTITVLNRGVPLQKKKRF